MNSHGIRRKVGEKKDEEAAILAYRKAFDDFLAARRDTDDKNEGGPDKARQTRLLETSAAVVEVNPECPTAWNERRRALKGGSDELLKSELGLTTNALGRAPKCYAVWEHRLWVLGQMEQPLWNKELKAAEALLSRDARNCELIFGLLLYAIAIYYFC